METRKKYKADKFNPSWINLLGESIMECHNESLPEFMCVGGKKHPFGNERYTICCGITSILWREHIFERKYKLAHLVPKLHLELGITVGLIIWIC